MGRKIILFMSLILLMVGVIYAPDMDRDRDQDMDRDRDQIRDPTTHIGDEPIQDRDMDRDRDQDMDRDRDRDQIRDPTTHIGDEPIYDRDMDRDRIQDRDRLVDTNLIIKDNRLITRDNLRDRQILITSDNPIQDRDMDRDRDRIRDPTTHVGDEPIQDRDRDRIGYSKVTVLNQNADTTTSPNIKIMENLATYNYMGDDAYRFNLVLGEVKNSYQNTVKAENNLMERSRVKKMFVGEDKSEIRKMQKELILNRERLRELRQISQNCDCEPQIRLLLQEQIRNMEQEQEGLENTANNYQNKKGLLGFLIK